MKSKREERGSITYSLPPVRIDSSLLRSNLLKIALCSRIVDFCLPALWYFSVVLYQLSHAQKDLRAMCGARVTHAALMSSSPFCNRDTCR